MFRYIEFYSEYIVEHSNMYTCTSVNNWTGFFFIKKSIVRFDNKRMFHISVCNSLSLYCLNDFKPLRHRRRSLKLAFQPVLVIIISIVSSKLQKEVCRVHFEKIWSFFLIFWWRLKGTLSRFCSKIIFRVLMFTVHQ